jgi:hypothetical protein
MGLWIVGVGVYTVVTLALGRFLFPRVEVKIVHEHAAPVPDSYERVKNAIAAASARTEARAERRSHR